MSTEGCTFHLHGAVVLALVMSGCAAVPRQAGFEDVQQDVAQRTQMRTHWIRGTEQDREVAVAVREMLLRELTPDAAVQIALLNNPELQATYEDLMVAQADLVAAGLLRNPVFSAEFKFIEGGGTNVELGVMQSFLDILYIPMRRRIADAEFDAAKQRITVETLDLARRTRTAFYTLQAAGQLAEMHGQILSATEASYELARRLREAGNITELEFASQRAVYEHARLDLAAAQTLALQQREDLNTLMGTWGTQTDWSIAPRLPDPPEHDPGAEEVERLALRQSPALAAAEQQVASAAARAGIAGPEATFADAKIGASAEREGDGTWKLGPAFAVPLPIWTQGKPARAAADAELRRARQLHAAAAVRLRAMTRTAHTSMTAARQRVEYYRTIMLPLRQRILEESMLQYNAMEIGTFELLTAQREQIRTGAEYIDALRDYWLARTELEWHIGSDLPLAPAPTEPFDPLAPLAEPEPALEDDHPHGHMHHDSSQAHEEHR